jgi:hypothetical protein
MVLLMAGLAPGLYAESVGDCPCFTVRQLKGKFSPIAKTGGMVRCQKYPGEAGTFVSIYGNSENGKSGLAMESMAAVQSTVDQTGAQFCYLDAIVYPPQEGKEVERFARYYYLSTEEANRCAEIIESTMRALGEECVEMD